MVLTMKISFSPQLRAAFVAASVTGDAITIDGVTYDFGPLAEGDTLPRAAVDCPWLASDVTRQEGQICLTLILPHGSSAPKATRFPEPVTIGTGIVPLPPFDAPSEVPTDD